MRRRVSFQQLGPVRTLDALIAIGLFALAMLYLGAPVDPQSSGLIARDFFGLVLIALLTLPLVWRQTAPRMVLAVIFSAWVLDRGLSYVDTPAMIGLLVAVHAVAAFLRGREAYAWGGGVLALGMAWTVAGMFTSDAVTAAHLATVFLAVAIPFTIGRADALTHDRMSDLELHQRFAEQARNDAADAAVRTERARIARELHDVVAHEITVMTLQAEGARRAIGDARPAVTDALRTIGESGRRGLAEMQRMIGALRDTSEHGDPEAEPPVGEAYAPGRVDFLSPMPALGSIPALVAQVGDSGLPVDLTITGNAHVPAGVELSAYRIVQESLTNALKHAGAGASARVTVTRARNEVTVAVEDDGRGVIADARRSGGGHGLAGMRERVLTLGGSIEFGPRPGGGFRVRAVLPSHDDTVAPASGGRTTPISDLINAQTTEDDA